MSIFDKEKAVETPASVRSVASITLELHDVRARIADREARRDALTTEKAALGVEQNPSASWRSEKIAAEIQTATFEIESGNRHAKALEYELTQVQLPAAREDDRRGGVKAEAALAAIHQSILAKVPALLDQLAKALELVDEANELHAKVEHLNGEAFMWRKYDLSPQVVAVLRPLWAFGTEPSEWHSRMFERGRENPRLWTP